MTDGGREGTCEVGLRALDAGRRVAIIVGDKGGAGDGKRQTNAPESRGL